MTQPRRPRDEETCDATALQNTSNSDDHTTIRSGSTNNEKKFHLPPCCCYWYTDTIESFRAQISPFQPWFEPDQETTDNNDDTLLLASTSQTRRAVILFWKISCCVLSLSTLGYGFHTFGSFYLAYFTHWALLATNVYFLASLSTAISVAVLQQHPNTESERMHVPGRPNFRIKLTWLFFELACHSEVGATSAYWPSVLAEGGLSLKGRPYYYNDVVCHGLLCVLVLVDGRLIHRIPFRWMHWVGFVLPFDALYVFVWLPLYEFLVGKNPLFEDQEWIYPQIMWRANWPLTLAFSFLALLVSFALFGLLWMMMRHHQKVNRSNNCQEDEDNASSIETGTR